MSTWRPKLFVVRSRSVDPFAPDDIEVIWHKMEQSGISPAPDSDLGYLASLDISDEELRGNDLILIGTALVDEFPELKKHITITPDKFIKDGITMQIRGFQTVTGFFWVFYITG
jgi:hypothetical protein